jgi:simple sugar transport system ATP-binding protein
MMQERLIICWVKTAAGKVQSSRICRGGHAPSEGQVIPEGHEHAALSPIMALASGIETVYQDLLLLPNLTVEENVALGEQLVGGMAAFCAVLIGRS